MDATNICRQSVPLPAGFENWDLYENSSVLGSTFFCKWSPSFSKPGQTTHFQISHASTGNLYLSNSTKNKVCLSSMHLRALHKDKKRATDWRVRKGDDQIYENQTSLASFNRQELPLSLREIGSRVVHPIYKKCHARKKCNEGIVRPFATVDVEEQKLTLHTERLSFPITRPIG